MEFCVIDNISSDLSQLSPRHGRAVRELDVLQLVGLSWEFFLTKWSAIRPQNERQHVDVLAAVEAARIAGGHALLDRSDEVVQRFVSPDGREFQSAQRGSLNPTPQTIAMAPRAPG